MKTVDRRLLLSLYARVLIALAVLGATSLVVLSVLGVLSAGVFGLLAFVPFVAVGVFAALPGPSSFVAIPPVVFVVLAGVGLLARRRGWLSDDVSIPVPAAVPERLRSSGPRSLAFTCWYLLAVEGSAALVGPLLELLETVGLLPVILVGAALGITVTLVQSVRLARGEARDLRKRLVDDCAPAREAYPEVRATTSRLARTADVPAPDVHVTTSARPESFTVGTGEDAMVVVSTGLVEALDDDEMEAVLAHEVTHLVNVDSRVMGAALLPGLIARDWVEKPVEQPSELFWNVVFAPLTWFSQLGVAVLSRGREWAADAGAVALTGSPAALAGALERLDERRRRPATDLRDWEQSVAALDVLPPTERDAATGPFRTHPQTEDRIDRLRRLAKRAETA